MKSKLLAASVAAALIITFISCNWFKSKPANEDFNIVGEWRIDSIENQGSDSSKFVSTLLLALASQDSVPVGIRFNNDSTFEYTQPNEPAKGKYYLSNDHNKLSLQEDSATYQFDIVKKSDSALSLSSVDSVFYYLRRK
jgi:hypothetical protein